MKNYLLIFVVLFFTHCSKKSDSSTPPVVVPGNFIVNDTRINGINAPGNNFVNIASPVISISFSSAIDRGTTTSNITFNQNSGGSILFNVGYSNGDSVILIQPNSTLSPLTKYSILLGTGLQSRQNVHLPTAVPITFITPIDSSNKFPTISDSALLTMVQQQTFKYFWDFGHPVSGLARERNTSGDLVTSGGSGFGVMAIVTGISRNYISRSQGLARMQTIVGFLKNTAQRFHGAYPHWLNGVTGAVIPFSANDNGADLVETSFLLEGLLTARQYFNGVDPGESALRNDINSIWNSVEWSWFRQSNQNVLYWHWSPNLSWVMNVQIRGWDEALMPYVLAASSTTFGIPKIVYDNGWASNGGMVNNNIFYGYQLPLGPASGGPLFFEHYSFLGINPNSLTDVYANYQTQAVNHTKINYEYCKANPNGYYGYSNACWGLTASDIQGGYTASSPTNDVGVIAPTAAISSLPYTPVESMKALKFFYYKLGDKLWGQYGFYDAFNLHNPWFADSYLAIDQGPIVIMIENFRTGLLWNLFTSCPEVKNGMRTLGFSASYL